MGTDPSQPAIAVSGATGLIGAALCARLAGAGHRVVRLVRRPVAAEDEAHWDSARGLVDPEQIRGVGAIVHLAGENIAAKRWTAARRRVIWSTRVDATRAFVSSLAQTEPPPALLCASAIGIYGDRGDEVLNEDSLPGRGFLPELCQAWEGEAAGTAAHGVRCVQLRFGVVLSSAGGMLARLLTLFRLGLGGPVGRGDQYLSWVSLDDAVAAIYHVLLAADISGPVNVVAPEPVTNAEFSRTLARILHRPAVLRVPASLLRLAFGQLADEALLASARVTPAVLLRHGFEFRHSRLENALAHLLGDLNG